jgi:hypothetical protein
MNLQETLVRDILPRVQKPSRYLGNELNAVTSKPGAEVRLALTFPDLYDLGLGNLGLHILYAILNRLEWCWAERVYAPDIDLEKELRARSLPLFAIESKDSLDAMDGIGFTPSRAHVHEHLNIIDLAGPLRPATSEDDALTFAGAGNNPGLLVHGLLRHRRRRARRRRDRGGAAPRKGPRHV